MTLKVCWLQPLTVLYTYLFFVCFCDLLVFKLEYRCRIQLKADRPHPRDYPPMPSYYRDTCTDKTLGLVMTKLPPITLSLPITLSPRFAVDKNVFTHNYAILGGCVNVDIFSFLSLLSDPFTIGKILIYVQNRIITYKLSQWLV